MTEFEKGRISLRIMRGKTEAAKIKFNCWKEFIGGTTNSERMNWCKEKAKTAKRARERIFQEGETYQAALGLSASDVWEVLEKAKGLCYHCNSLALEKQPVGEWQYMGRRIGSLDHIIPLSKGGDNNKENLVWSCLLCNSHARLSLNGRTINIRTPYHDSFGGYYPTLKKGRGRLISHMRRFFI